MAGNARIYGDSMHQASRNRRYCRQQFGSTLVRGFRLDAYSDEDLFRQINFQTEGIQIGLQCNVEI